MEKDLIPPPFGAGFSLANTMFTFDPTISLGDLVAVVTAVLAILFAWWGLRRQSKIQHKNNIKRDKMAKLQRELDAAKKLRALLTTYQAITEQVIEKINECQQRGLSQDGMLQMLEYLGATYASQRISASVIHSDLRAAESRIFTEFLMQSFAIESFLIAKYFNPETGVRKPPTLHEKKSMVKKFYSDLCAFAKKADDAIAQLNTELDDIKDSK